MIYAKQKKHFLPKPNRSRAIYEPTACHVAHAWPVLCIPALKLLS